MRTDNIAVFDLFEKQRRYLVPIFQRGYVWTQADQWEPLWKDLQDQAEAVREGIARPRQKIRRHFLGAIVLNQAQTTVRQVSAFEVIDGQQRLMTLQILLAVLRDITKEIGGDYLKSNLERLTNNPGPFIDPSEVYKVWPTNAYREDLQRVMMAGSAEALAAKYPQRYSYRKWIPPRPPIVEAYLYFTEAVTEYLRHSGGGSNESPQTQVLDVERAEELFEAATRHFHLVVIELDAEDDPQVIFETLNARGVPLEPSDLIRNFVFLHAVRRGENVQDLYERWWKEFDEPAQGRVGFWKEQERQGRLRRSRLDRFFFHYLTFRWGHELTIGHLFQEFRDWWNDTTEERTVAKELEVTNSFSKIFRSLLEPSSDSRFGLFARRLQISDTATVYPLVFWLCEQRDRVPAGEFEGMLEDIESYLIRRSVCNLTTKSYNRIFVALLNKLRSEGLPNRTALRRELAAFEGESASWPNDKEFREHLIDKPLYESLGPGKTRMLLEALELALQTPRHERVQIDGFLTVEHILPRSAAYDSSSWPYFASQGMTSWQLALNRVRLMHSLGNLTLLTQPLNSLVSDGPFAQKRPAIAQQSKLALNAYFQHFADTDAWHEETIARRGQELAELAVRIWPHPG